MAKQLNIDMNIRANTNSAQAELKKLKQTLDDAINSTIKKSGNTKLTSEITEATQAAAKLKLALENATNVKTGNLDLSKFSEELSKSKMNLKQYSTQLLNLGSTGEKAFLQMANAIASAEIPLRRSNGLLTGLWTTMKNTARWQLSSTALHGFLGAIQGAYGYAQKLNTSLNNIQIVTGQSSEQMAKFAEEANKSAKALSTTTTAYTDAALIYYQQGLSGDEVKERTDATIKLANVSRQSAEEVSSQMTSIWNNFSKGGENLEYYADVITKLGATTASSSSEIADGLSKFAAVADTVGLSYEKASAALATVVAETRQSADTVGTAFKTLFARVEGLQLGKTLEDGVDLNKYSKALDTVGVKILDNNKQIKQMDTILDELGAKWDTIGKSEQIALAQTVAGARQYTQFMSLMNNYDKVQKNQAIAEDSEGTLQKQADIYAESWEAANKRVKAAAQGIYDELLNDKFFIGLNNSLAGILEGINKFIKSLGGIPGILGLLGTVATTVFKDQIALSIDNAIHNLAVFSGVAQDKAKQMQNDMIQVIESMNSSGMASGAQQAENTRMIETLKLTQQLSEKKDKLLEQDYEQLKLLTDITAQYGEQAVAAAKEADKAEVNEGQSRKKFVMNYRNDQIANNDFMETEKTDEFVDEKANEVATETADNIKRIVTQVEAGKAAVEALQQSFMGIDEGFNSENFEKIAMNLQMIKDEDGKVPSVFKGSQTALLNYGEAVQEVKEKEENLSKAQKRVNDLKKQGKTKTNEYKEALNKQKEATKALEESEKKVEKAEKQVHTQLKTHITSRKTMNNAVKKAQQAHEELNTTIIKEAKNNPDMKKHIKQMQEYGGAIADNIDKQNTNFEAQQNYKKNVEETQKAIEQASSTMKTSFGQSLTTTFRGVSQLSMGLNSLKGMFETLNNEDMSFGEKFLSVTTSLGIAIPSLIGGFSNLKQSFGEVRAGVESGIKAFVLHIGAMTADEAASESLTFAEVRRAFNTAVAKKVTDAETTSLWADVVAKVAAKIATDALNASMLLLLAAILLVVAAAVGLVAIFNAIKANSPEEKLKKAEENAKALAEAFEDAKNKAQELKDSFNKYNEIVNKLNSCVKGTEEWRDTLKEVNSQILSLIEQYPELSKYVTTDFDGVMRISKEGQTKLTNKANQAVSVAEAASVEANQEVRQKRMDVQASNINAKATQTIPGQSYSGTNSGTSSKNTTDASNIVKRYINENREELAEMTEDQLRANLKAYFDKNNISGNMDDWVTAAQELTKAVKEDTETTKAETKAIVSNRLADNKKVSASTEFKEISDASSQLYNELIENQTKKLEDDGWGTEGISKADGANKQAKTIWEEYLKAANLDPSKYKLTDTTGDDNNRKFVYNDENGEKKEITLEQMRATKASSEALKELDSTAEQITKDFQKLSVSTNKTDQALESFLANKNFESASAGEVADFSKFVSNGEANTESIQEYLTEQAGKLGYEDLTSMAKEYGYKSADEYVKAFSEKAVDISKAWDNIDLEKMGLDKAKGWAQNLSSTAAKALSDNFDKIKFGPKGEEAAQEYIDGIGSMIEGLDVDDQKKALEDLAKIDWSGYEAFDEAAITMKKYGKILDENDLKWDAFIADMRKANSSVPDFSSLNENLTSISKILGKLNFGDIIEDGDYEKLIKYKDAWKEFFMMQADGTRKFIGDADEMRKAAQESIREAKKDMEERRDIQDELNKDNTVNSEDWEKRSNDIIDLKDSGGNKQNDKVSLSTGVLSNTNVKAALNAQGYTEENITRIVNNYNDSLGSTSESAKNAKESMANLYKAIEEFSTEAINTKDQQEKLNEELASTAINLNDLRTMYENSEISADAYDKQLTSLAMTTKSLSELQNLRDNGGILDEESEAHYLDTEEYSRALMSLAENYENCTNEVSEYQQALASGSAELINETQAILENSIAVGEMAKSLDLEADSVEEQAKELISVNKLSEENYKVATKVAVLNQSMNKGVQDLVDNWSKYKDTLKKSEKGTEDYANAALKTKKALAQLLGITNEEFIPDDFLEMPGIMDSIDKAIKGDEKVINSLGAIMAKATIEAMNFKEGMLGFAESTGKTFELEESQFKDYKNEILEGITSLTEAITNGTLQAGEDITSLMDGTGQSWIKALNQMAYATGMSVEEMNSLLNELGVQADVTVRDKEVETSVPEYTTYEIDGEDVKDDKNTDLTSSGYHIAKKSVTVQTGVKKVKGSISVAQINMGKNAGTPPTITYAGRDNVSSSALTPSSSSSGNSSSSSSSTPTTKAASHTHEINRYTAEENAIDGLSKQYEKLNNIKDKSFGKGKIQAIENEIKALKELKQASINYMDAIVGDGNGKRIAEAIYRGENIGDLLRNGAISGNLGSDYRALSYGISASGKQVEYTAKDEAGNEWLASRDYNINDFNTMFGTNIHFDLDAFGNIQNADSIKNQLQQLKNNESDAYSSIADPTADSTTRYNERVAYIDEILDRMDTFGDSINTLSEQSEEYLDYITQLQEKNAELITSKMELGVELGDKSLRRIDRALKVLGNDIYRSVETMTKAFELNDQKIESSQEKAQSYQEMMNEAERRFALYQENPLNEDAITPAEYAEMLSTAEEGFESIADEMREYMNYFYDIYSGMQDYWEEKISRVAKQMEDSIKVLEYYQKVLELTGRSGDYELIGKILEGQAETAKTIFKTSQARAELAKKEWERQKDDLEKARLDPTLSKDLLDTLENMTELAYEKYVEAVETAREDSLNYLEITQTAFENKIKQMRVESEKFLTNGSDFDSLNKSMERQKSLSEDYLTKTNQLYETNKMLRQLNQDIDKTDSVIAKNKLKAFADEISAMQDQEKLSNTSLEIAKAKYEILQAQIALEDVQNAKSTVQLRRDSEGNYGYVYTADEEAVNNAQQNLEDKVNALYNLGKKASEDFAEQMIQLEQEEWAEIEEIANNTILTTDEKNIKIAELQEYYNAKRQALSEQYEEANLALQQGAVAQRLLITDKFNTENFDIEKIAAEARAEAWTESFTTTIKDQNTYEVHFKQLASQLKSEMQKLDDKREQHEQATKTGNKEIKESIDDITNAVDDLSYEILKRDGLLDSYSDALNASDALKDSFKRQYETARELANQYSNAADRASDLYTKTVDLVHAQVALNHANNGATHIEWGSGGVTADYNGNTVSSDSNSIINSSANQKVTSQSEAYDTITRYVQGMKLRKGDYNRWGQAFKTSGVLEEWLLLDPSQREHIKNIYGYKTGGYTGSWNGPDVEENGKLAFLHQKELVLNTDDTENMLNAVKLIRQISESIDLQAAVQSSYSVGAIQFPGNNQVLQQEVTIHAEFPNATDHNEIEEAFNSLVNRASQYANRN